MNYVDLLLIAVLALAMWIGWQKGFIMGTINLLVWAGSLVLGFWLYPYLSGALHSLLPSLGVWNLPLSFLLTVIAARLLLAALFNAMLRRMPEENHHHRLNHLLGLVPGAINGLLYAIVIAAVLLTANLPKSSLTTETQNSRVIGAMARNVGWIGGQLAPIFNDAIGQTFTRTTVEPESNETVQLNFTVTDTKPRPDLEARMLELVNAERTSRGLGALVADPLLVPVGRAHDADMFARGYFSHYAPDGRDPFDRMKAAGIRYSVAGENLALGQTLKICHEGLMNSPGHRANILNPSYGRVGIGILDGGSHGLMIAQEFRN